MFEMIDGVGKSGPGPIDLGRAEKGAGPARVANAGIRSGESPVQSAVFGLVSGGAPADGAKVASIPPRNPPRPLSGRPRQDRRAHDRARPAALMSLFVLDRLASCHEA